MLKEKISKENSTLKNDFKKRIKIELRKHERKYRYRNREKISNFKRKLEFHIYFMKSKLKYD